MVAILVCLALMGCGSATTVTQTVQAPQPTTTIQAADPTQDATCTIEPNGAPPVCYQGSYQVSLTLGAPCVDPQYQQPEVWQQTYSGSTTVRCEPAAG